MKNEENIAKNICPLCDGLTTVGDLEIKCICEDGTYIGYLINWELWNAKQNIIQLRNDYKDLQEWVKETSKCSKCGGDQYRTPGLNTCKECGLPGLQVWGG